MINEIDLVEQREQIQEDLLCILDGYDDNEMMSNVCDVIADRFEILINKCYVQEE